MGILLSTLALASPLLLALGEIVGERAGVLIISVEAMILCGACAASFASQSAGEAILAILAASSFALLVCVFSGCHCGWNRAELARSGAE